MYKIGIKFVIVGVVSKIMVFVSRAVAVWVSTVSMAGTILS